MTYYQTVIEAWKQGDHKKAIQYFNYASQYGSEYEIKNAKMYLSEYEKLGDSITKNKTDLLKEKLRNVELKPRIKSTITTGLKEEFERNVEDLKAEIKEHPIKSAIMAGRVVGRIWGLWN